MLIPEEKIHYIHEQGRWEDRDRLTKEAVDKAIREGRCYETAVLITPEPERTHILEYMDGISRATNTRDIPVYGSSAPLDPWPAGIWLVALKPDAPIKADREVEETILGTNKTRKIWRHVTLGVGTAKVSNMWPARQARSILFKYGPTHGRDFEKVEIVELAWLRVEAQREVPSAGLPELFEQLAQRPDVQKVLAELDAGAATSPAKRKAG